MESFANLQTEIAALLEHLNVEVPSFHDDLIESGLLDSLKIVELLAELEVRFEMKIPLDALEIDIFRSVTTVADFVMSYKRSQVVPDAAAPASVSGDVPLTVAE